MGLEAHILIFMHSCFNLIVRFRCRKLLNCLCYNYTCAVGSLLPASNRTTYSNSDMNLNDLGFSELSRILINYDFTKWKVL